jgi:predicted negative regulator of RcsB-dependent stress response
MEIYSQKSEEHKENIRNFFKGAGIGIITVLIILLLFSLTVGNPI